MRWNKEEDVIAEATQSITIAVNSRFKIDRDTYSLIIDPANTKDTSSNYQCDLSVINPITNVVSFLQPSPSVTLSLEVTSKYLICYS